MDVNDLTEDQAKLLMQLEHRPVEQHSATEARYRADLDALVDAGFARKTGVTWVITNAGRRRLVPEDGRMRLTVEPWNRQSRQGGQPR